MKVSKRQTKRLSVLMTVLLLFSVFGLAVPAYAEDVKETVSYVDENGLEQTVEATVLESGSYGAAGETNWYVLKGEVECTAVISLNDAVANVILADDAAWTFRSTTMCALNLNNGDLNLYAQKNGTGAITTGQRFGANYGNLHLYGGKVTAQALFANPSDKTLTVDGGEFRVDTVYAKNFTLNGGELYMKNCTSVSGDIEITGGKYDCRGGSMALMSQNAGVKISGGEVTAIGSSMGISAKSVSITGGEVTVSGNTMGIISGNISITGGKADLYGGVFSVYPTGADAVVLGCIMPDSSITLQSALLSDAAYTVVDGQMLTDGENEYAGALTAEEIAALTGKTLTCKHDVIVKGAGAPTCVDEGFSGSEYCSVCGTCLSEGEILPPTGEHVTVLVNAKEATATENGYTGDLVCTVCNQTVQYGEVIPATGTPGTACRWCGDAHDKTTFAGWWVSFLHDLLFVVTRLLTWWK